MTDEQVKRKAGRPRKAEPYEGVSYWRAQNSEKYRAYERERHARRVAERRVWMDNLKRQRGCLICGETEPCCLDWHHDPNQPKTLKIATSVTHSEARIMQEIERCVLVCANCHRKIENKVIQDPFDA